MAGWSTFEKYCLPLIIHVPTIFLFLLSVLLQTDENICSTKDEWGKQLCEINIDEKLRQKKNSKNDRLSKKDQQDEKNEIKLNEVISVMKIFRKTNNLTSFTTFLAKENDGNINEGGN